MKIQGMKRVRVAIVVLAGAAAFSALQPSAWGRAVVPSDVTELSPLEGTRWRVRVIPDGMNANHGEKAFDDILVFEDGTLASEQIARFGFRPSRYFLTRSGDRWAFSTEQISPAAGRSTWVVSVNDDGISGRITWTRRDGAVLNYLFEGSQVGEGAAVPTDILSLAP